MPLLLDDTKDCFLRNPVVEESRGRCSPAAGNLRGRLPRAPAHTGGVGLETTEVEAFSRELPARNPGMALALSRHRVRTQMMASAMGLATSKPSRRGRSKQEETPMAKVYQAHELARRVFMLAMCGFGVVITLSVLLTLWEW